MKICIIGLGTAGLASAIFLAKQGHQITVHEVADVLKPVGAGLLLQPTGLEILAKLDLITQAEALGSRVDSLLGKTLSNRKVLELHYQDLKTDSYGLGIHRASLFDVLYNKFKTLGIDLQINCPITAYKHHENQVEVFNGKEEVDSCDLLIVANGARSSLRQLSPYFQSDHEYPWGAIWSITPMDGSIKPNVLEQKYQSAHTMLGLLPTGNLPHSQKSSQKPLVSLFWSLPTKDFQDIQSFNLNKWKDTCVKQWPLTQSVVKQIHNKEQIAFATYRDVRLKQFNHGQVVFIGDAAHGMSPQLGQGANMALIDAYYLSQMVKEKDTLSEDLQKYNDIRKKHINYYQFMSRWLTPFYQSHSKFLGGIKDYCSYPATKIPFVHTQMLRTLFGESCYTKL